MVYTCFKPFHAIGLFLFALKTSKKLSFSDVFRRYRMGQMVLHRFFGKTALRQIKKNKSETTRICISHMGKSIQEWPK